MKSQRLDDLVCNGFAFDLETHLIQPGLAAPPIVCGSAASVQAGRIVGDMGLREDALAIFRTILGNEQLTLIGAMIAFDVICQMVAYGRLGIDLAPEVFRMYDPQRGAIHGVVDGRVIDVQVWEMLHAIAKGHLGLDPRTFRRIMDPVTHKPGRYSLREVVKQVLGRDNAKANDRFRMSYALLENVPLHEWPTEARTYPVDDAVNTLETALAQAGHIDNIGTHEWVESTGMGAPPHCARCDATPGALADCRSKYRRLNSHDLSRQTYVSFCMNLGGAWGFHVDQNAVDAVEAKYHAEHDHLRQPFIDAGILRADNTENQSVLKRMVAQSYGARVACLVCQGTGKVPSPTTQGKTKINCKECQGTTLQLIPEVPRTEKNGIGTGRDVLRESGVEFLINYAEYDEGSKIPNTYIPFLRATDRDGVAHPGMPLNLRPNPILETGRTSYDGVIQLLPRSGGIRECIVARPGYVFSSEDYKAGELVTHAQSCIWLVGASRLAQALNKGLDAHLAGAATVLGISYEEAEKRKKAGDRQIKDGRQAFKPANFGFPGRMGAFKLVVQQRKGGPDTPHPSGKILVDDGKGNLVPGYKGLRFCLLMGAADVCGEVRINEWNGKKYTSYVCKRCVECATRLKKSWLAQWPENEIYFNKVKLMDESGLPIVQHMSKRLRGFRHGLVDDNGEPINSGNAIANGFFQGLLADAAKNAMLAATRECYDRTTRVQSFTRHTSAYEGGPSPLYGSRLIVFQHDEHVYEHPESVYHDAAMRASELMCEALRIACPDLDAAVEAEPTIMRRLYKGAERRHLCACGKINDLPKCKTCDRTDGKLIPWEPKKAS